VRWALADFFADGDDDAFQHDHMVPKPRAMATANLTQTGMNLVSFSMAD